MNDATLKKRLQGLADGARRPNAPVVEAYLADPEAGPVARLLTSATGPHPFATTPLLPPSRCLPLLD